MVHFCHLRLFLGIEVMTLVHAFQLCILYLSQKFHLSRCFTSTVLRFVDEENVKIFLDL